VAADASPSRLRAAALGLRRIGSDVSVAAMDARRPALRSARTVLVDAPCSGTGALRRRPDARWRLSPRRLASLLRLQAELLDACSALLPPGGLLVYATCSLEREENERQVEEFLLRRPDFERAGPGGGEVSPELLTARGDLEVLPFRTGADGAYASRLRRKGEAG
jgi:16S rRNA (cytosine967-C5)-methyltransferase